MILNVIAGVVVALLLIGFVYERISRYRYNKKRPKKEDFVQVGNRRLHFHKMGEGDKTIIFESGLGGDYMHWKEMQKALSQEYTTLSYDRAGILWSDYSEDSSLARFGEDLNLLLEATGCPKPYILVGHSFAGILSRLWIRDNKQDIEGIVFVDVTNPRQFEEFSQELQNAGRPPSLLLLKLLNSTGIIRFLYNRKAFLSILPKDHWFNVHVANYFYRALPGMLQELENDRDLMNEAGAISSFGDIPLVILTGKYPKGLHVPLDEKLTEEFMAKHNKLQSELLELSSRSKQIFAENSGHYITLEEPDVIVSAVRELVENQ